MAAYAQHDTAFFSRRAVAFVAICLLHVVLIYGFSSGLGHKALEIIAPPIQTDIVQEVQKRDEPPPPPPPKMERPPVEVPPPDVAINVPVETASTAITDVTNKPAPAAPPPPPKAVNHQPGGAGKNFPNSDEYYPPTSRRMGETGAAVVKVCVDAGGKLTQDPVVQTTSGSARLDDGALKLAKAASGKYKPATDDGKPVTSCFPLRIRFDLKD
jgi:periplasmic protein TonB